MSMSKEEINKRNDEMNHSHRTPIFDSNAGNSELTFEQRMARIEIGEIQKEHYNRVPPGSLPPVIPDELRKRAGLPTGNKLLHIQTVLRDDPEFHNVKYEIPGLNPDNLSACSTVITSDCSISKQHVVGHAAVDCITGAIKAVPSLQDPRVGCVQGAIEGTVIGLGVELSKQSECENRFKSHYNVEERKTSSENNIINRIEAQLNYKPSEICKKDVHIFVTEPATPPVSLPLLFSAPVQNALPSTTQTQHVISTPTLPAAAVQSTPAQSAAFSATNTIAASVVSPLPAATVPAVTFSQQATSVISPSAAKNAVETLSLTQPVAVRPPQPVIAVPAPKPQPKPQPPQQSRGFNPHAYVALRSGNGARSVRITGGIRF